MRPFSPHLKTGTEPASETVCFLVIENSGRWTKPRNPVNLSALLCAYMNVTLGAPVRWMPSTRFVTTQIPNRIHVMKMPRRSPQYWWGIRSSLGPDLNGVHIRQPDGQIYTNRFGNVRSFLRSYSRGRQAWRECKAISGVGFLLTCSCVCCQEFVCSEEVQLVGNWKRSSL
jgi:hypothetical protein